MEVPDVHACWCKSDDELAMYLNKLDIPLPIRHCHQHRDAEDGRILRKDMVECCSIRFYTAGDLAEHKRQAHRPPAPILPAPIPANNMELAQGGGLIPYAGVPRLAAGLPFAPNIMGSDRPVVRVHSANCRFRKANAPSPEVNLNPNMASFLAPSPTSIASNDGHDVSLSTPNLTAAASATPAFWEDFMDDSDPADEGNDEFEFNHMGNQLARPIASESLRGSEATARFSQDLVANADMPDASFNPGAVQRPMERLRKAKPAVLHQAPRRVSTRHVKAVAGQPSEPMVQSRRKESSTQSHGAHPNTRSQAIISSGVRSVKVEKPRTRYTGLRPDTRKSGVRETGKATGSSPFPTRNMRTRASAAAQAEEVPAVIESSPFKNYASFVCHIKALNVTSPAATAQFISILSSLTALEFGPLFLQQPSVWDLANPLTRRLSHEEALVKLRKLYADNPNLIEEFAKILVLSTEGDEEFEAAVSEKLESKYIEAVKTQHKNANKNANAADMQGSQGMQKNIVKDSEKPTTTTTRTTRSASKGKINAAAFAAAATKGSTKGFNSDNLLPESDSDRTPVRRSARNRMSGGFAAPAPAPRPDLTTETTPTPALRRAPKRGQ